MSDRLSSPAKPARDRSRRELWFVVVPLLWPAVILWPLTLIGGRYRYVRGVEEDTWVEFWAVPLAFVLWIVIPWAARRFVGERRGRAFLVHSVAGFLALLCADLGRDPHGPHRWRDRLVLSGVFGPALAGLLTAVERRRKLRLGERPR